MKKSGRIFVIAALTVAMHVAFAAGPQKPQPPQPVPPIIQPFPGPIGPGPDSGPVDPTPTQPPPSN